MAAAALPTLSNARLQVRKGWHRVERARKHSQAALPALHLRPLPLCSLVQKGLVLERRRGLDGGLQHCCLLLVRRRPTARESVPVPHL